MSLPILKSPIYTITIPSTKEEIKFKAFTVKEENALLIAKESDDKQIAIDTIISVLKDCTFDKIDIEKLATFDIEYLFVNIRAKSVGEIIEIDMRCKSTDENDVKCGGLIPFSINLTEVDVVFDKEHTNTVMIGDEIGIKFKYPSTESFNKTKEIMKSQPVMGLVTLIDYIFEGDSTYEAASVSKDDLIKWVESIPSKPFKKIKENFIDNMPTLKHVEDWKCPKCGKQGKHTFEGLADFFG